MNNKRKIVGQCENCGRDLRTRGTIDPIMKFTCKCGHANIIHVDDSLLDPWREEQILKEDYKLIKDLEEKVRCRSVNSPYMLTNSIKTSPDNTELVIGSSFFLRRLINDSDWEVWLTPKRCHFRINQNNLSSEAQDIIDNNLPHFVNLFKPDAIKISKGNEWSWQKVTEEIDFIYTPSESFGYVNSFCIMGNWVTLAGPYVFYDPGYGIESRSWGWLKDVNVDFVEETLGINFICNEKPWLTVQNFSDFIVESHKPCPSISSYIRNKKNKAGNN